jgi:hypothetical protein
MLVEELAKRGQHDAAAVVVDEAVVVAVDADLLNRLLRVLERIVHDFALADRHDSV